MRKKLYCLIILAVFVWIASFFVSFTLGIVLTILGILCISSISIFLIVNKLIKYTNWWKNQYLATNQFVSNAGYRDNIIRNYDVINLGSNPSHFAFFYQDVKGQSWATGSQGQDMDFEILKYFHSYIKEGGTVIIPIMPFTAISTYLKERPDYWGLSYYSKFAKIIDSAQLTKMPFSRLKLQLYLRFPLLFNPRAIIYLFHDCNPDNRYQLSEQLMMKMELQQDAENLIKGWKKEFRLQSLEEVMDSRWSKYYLEAIELNKQIVNYCFERGYKPVFVCAPMTKFLSDLFPQEARNYLIRDFVSKANDKNIPFLDYTLSEDFQDPNLYFNSFFLNMRGRKLFTQRVLKDLNLI